MEEQGNWYPLTPMCPPHFNHHPQSCATLGWTPSDCSFRYLCTLCYAFIFSQAAL